MDTLQSLVKAEWDDVKRFQSLIQTEWDKVDRKNLIPRSCCGVLFFGNHGYACNGHWLIKFRCPVTDKFSVIPDVDHFFYDYTEDDVKLNYNPFEVADLTIPRIKDIFNFKWDPHNIKVRVEDVKNLIYAYYKLVKSRRTVSFVGTVDAERGRLSVAFEEKVGVVAENSIPLWVKEGYDIPHGATFSVNASYLFKMMEVVEPWYHVVDLAFSDNSDKPIHIKAYNPREEKPDIRIALAQFDIK